MTLRSRTTTRTFAIAIAVLILLGVAIALSARYGSLTVTEPRSLEFGGADLGPTESVASLELEVPLAALQEAIHDALPEVLAVIDENVGTSGCAVRQLLGDGCMIGWSASVHASGAVRRVGRPRIDVQSGGLRVTQNVAGVATLTPRGDIGRLVGLQETASGAADVSFTVAVDVNSDWSITASASPSYSWTDPIGITVLGQRITFRSAVEESLTGMLQSAARSVEDEIRQQFVLVDAKRQIEEMAATAHAVSTQPPMFLVVRPTEVGVGRFREAHGMLVLPAHVRFTAALHVASSPTIEGSPDVAFTQEVPEPAITMIVPSFVAYSEIASHAMDAIGDDPIEFEAGVLRGQLRVSDVQLHPTGAQLALTVAFRADLAGPLPTVRGVLNLVATPDYDGTTQTLRLADVSYTADVDHALARLALAFKRSEIVDALGTVTVDLVPLIEDLQRRLNANLADVELTPGVSVNGRVDSIRVRDVQIGEDLIVVTTAHGRLGAIIDPTVTE